MKISFLGAARTVTGSQHLLTVNGHKLLLDCGLYQGRPKDAEDFNRNFDFNPAEIDAVLLSHAHIDHSGNLPGLVKQGYEGPIYATHVTTHLADIMLRDSAHIQEMIAEESSDEKNGKGNGKKNGSKRNGGNGNGRHPQPVEPLYAMEDAAKVAQYFRKVKYNNPFEVVPGVTAVMVEAGHILGSAAIVLEVEEKGRKRRLWFSGDIGRLKLPLVRDPMLPDGTVDTLIMECTYGNKSHDDPEAAYDELYGVLKRTFDRGGKVIIPAFAVGRTQEIVYFIHQMIKSGDIPEIPVYVDSPLAVEASKIFASHDQYFDEEAQDFVEETDSYSALGFDRLTYIESVQESRALNDRDEPMVIISASGMAETGRVVHHIRHNIADPRTTILIVSYQAPNTLGRALANGDEQVKILGKVYNRMAEVAQVSGLSAHAGQRFLQKYAEAAKGGVEQVFLVHGEDEPAQALQEKLKAAGMDNVYYPYLRQTMEL